jgi:hypothetical protein
MSQKTNVEFCAPACHDIYHKSEDIYCKECDSLLGKLSNTNKQFCDLKCSNLYQKRINKVDRVCIVCETIYTVQKSSHRHKLCSKKCESAHAASSDRNDRGKQTREATNLKRYGVKHVMSIPEIHEKACITKLNLYGNLNNQKKIQATNLKRYGVKHVMSVKKINEKAIQTKLDRHGTLNFNVLANQTKLEKYGTLNFSDKANQTKLEKYGTLNFSDKALQTKLDRYGENTRHYIEHSYHRMKDKYGDRVEFLFNKEEYNGAYGYVKYSFRCISCDTKFEDSITNGSPPICPHCHPSTTSKPQNEVYEYIRSLLPKEDIVINSRSVIDPLELDIYIPSKKIAIEFNGIYWHCEVSGGKDKKYHLYKTMECERKNIRLIHIFENEWHENKPLLKSKLSHILGNSCRKSIYARKCIVKEISSKLKSNFLNEHHIQGNDKSSVRIGAYHDNILVAVMTFGNRRCALGNKHVISNSYEMYRFCTSRHVQGVGGKLLSYFIKQYDPDNIISFADRRYSNDESFYKHIGFTFIGYTPPNYWYYRPHTKLYHRFNFRKDQLHKKLKVFNPDISEWGNMKNNGWDRIWDCGNIKFEWIKP